MTVRDAANYLRVSECTVYRYAERGELPHIKKNFGLRFKKEDLDEYLDRDTIKAIPAPCLPPEYPYMVGTVGIMSGGYDSEMAKSKSKKSRWVFNNGFVFTRKTKSGRLRFYIEFYDAKNERTRRVAKNATTIEGAKVALDREIQREYDLKLGIKRKEKIKFKDFAPKYIADYAKGRKKSWRSDEKYIKAELIPFFGEFELSEVTPVDVNRFIRKRQKDGVKNSTINRELTVLKKMLNLAIKWNFEIQDNPVTSDDFFKEDIYKRSRVLSIEEEEMLLKEAAPHLKPIIQCALLTGCRLQEHLMLLITDINFSSDVITIRADNNKSGKRDIIPMTFKLKSLLTRIVEENRGRSKFVFNYADPFTDELRPIKTIRRSFSSACRRAKIKDLQFRDLRRTYSTRLHEMGIDPLIIQRLLRHSSFKISEEVYIQSSFRQMKEAVDMLDKRSLKSQKN